MRLFWAWLLVAGCYSPSPPDGIACSSGSPGTGVDKRCPESLFCSFGTCVSEVAECLPIEAGAGKLTAPRLREAPIIDGNVEDWPTCFVTVDQSTAGLVRDLNSDGKFAPGRFSIAAFDDLLYVVAEVQSVLPLGDHAIPNIFLNNAISVYVDADGDFDNAPYDTDAAQIVVDHANRTAAFRSGMGLVSVPIDSATQTSASTFTIEMAISPSSLGRTTFTDTIGFDIGLVGGDGEVMTSELVWFQACTEPECGCLGGQDSAPFCDSRQFGTAMFAP